MLQPALYFHAIPPRAYRNIVVAVADDLEHVLQILLIGKSERLNEVVGQHRLNEPAWPLSLIYVVVDIFFGDLLHFGFSDIGICDDITLRPGVRK